MAKKIAKIEDCLTMQSLLDEIADKWTVLVMGIISDGPKRFNQIKNSLDGVSQKSLTQCLRRLERNGLVTRTVIDGNVLGVEYSLTELGYSLQTPFSALFDWVTLNGVKMEDSQKAFDKKKK